MNWFKKRPRVSTKDFDELIEATPSADSSYKFYIPEHLEGAVRWALGKPFCLLYYQKYKGFRFYPADDDELGITLRKSRMWIEPGITYK